MRINLNVLRSLLLLGIIITGAAFGSEAISDIVGPIEYKGYLSFAYSEGENPINLIVFTVDEAIAPNLLIINVPAGWSHSYYNRVLTLTGGQLSPGDMVNVQVSLDKYHESGSYDIEASGTTVLGETSFSSGVLLVGEMYILMFLGLLNVFRYPILVSALGLGFAEIWMWMKRGSGFREVDKVVDELEPPPVEISPYGNETVEEGEIFDWSESEDGASPPDTRMHFQCDACIPEFDCPDCDRYPELIEDLGKFTFNGGSRTREMDETPDFSDPDDYSDDAPTRARE